MTQIILELVGFGFLVPCSLFLFLRSAPNWVLQCCKSGVAFSEAFGYNQLASEPRLLQTCSIADNRKLYYAFHTSLCATIQNAAASEAMLHACTLSVHVKYEFAINSDTYRKGKYRMTFRFTVESWSNRVINFIFINLLRVVLLFVDP